MRGLWINRERARRGSRMDTGLPERPQFLQHANVGQGDAYVLALPEDYEAMDRFPVQDLAAGTTFFMVSFSRVDGPDPVA